MDSSRKERMINEFFGTPSSVTEDAVIVYIEQFNRNEKTVLIDFIDKPSFINFIGAANREIDADGPSMIFINNYFGKRIQEDTFYILNKESISLLFDQELFTAVNDSLIIAYSVDLVHRTLYYLKNRFLQKV